MSTPISLALLDVSVSALFPACLLNESITSLPGDQSDGIPSSRRTNALDLGIEVVETRTMSDEERRVRSALATQKKLYSRMKQKYEAAEQARVAAEQGRTIAEQAALQLRSALEDVQGTNSGGAGLTLVPLSVMEEMLECGICLDLNWRPALLPCGHCFCEECLYTHFAEARETALNRSDPPRPPTYACPACRDSYIIRQTPKECFALKALVEKLGVLGGRTPPPKPQARAGGRWMPFFR